MTRFRLKIDGVLVATDLDEALAKIADHFTKLSCGVLPADLFEHELQFVLAEYDPKQDPGTWERAWDVFEQREDKKQETSASE